MTDEKILSSLLHITVLLNVPVQLSRHLLSTSGASKDIERTRKRGKKSLVPGKQSCKKISTFTRMDADMAPVFWAFSASSVSA